MRLDVLYGAPVIKPAAAAVMLSDSGPPTWNGIQYRISPMAVDHHAAFDIIKSPRRRKRYIVKKRTWTTPGMLLMGGQFLGRELVLIHPDIAAKLGLS